MDTQSQLTIKPLLTFNSFSPTLEVPRMIKKIKHQSFPRSLQNAVQFGTESCLFLNKNKIASVDVELKYFTQQSNFGYFKITKWSHYTC